MCWRRTRLARLGLSRRRLRVARCLPRWRHFKSVRRSEARHVHAGFRAFLVARSTGTLRWSRQGRRFEWIAYDNDAERRGPVGREHRRAGIRGQAVPVLTGDGRSGFWPWIAGVLAAGALFVTWLRTPRRADSSRARNGNISPIHAMGIFKIAARRDCFSLVPLVSAPPGSLHSRWSTG